MDSRCLPRYRNLRYGYVYTYDPETQLCKTVPECTPDWQRSSYVRGTRLSAERIQRQLDRGAWVVEFPEILRVPEGL